MDVKKIHFDRDTTEDAIESYLAKMTDNAKIKTIMTEFLSLSEAGLAFQSDLVFIFKKSNGTSTLKNLPEFYDRVKTNIKQRLQSLKMNSPDIIFYESDTIQSLMSACEKNKIDISEMRKDELKSTINTFCSPSLDTDTIPKIIYYGKNLGYSPIEIFTIFFEYRLSAYYNNQIIGNKHYKNTLEIIRSDITWFAKCYKLDESTLNEKINKYIVELIKTDLKKVLEKEKTNRPTYINELSLIASTQDIIQPKNWGSELKKMITVAEFYLQSQKFDNENISLNNNNTFFLTLSKPFSRQWNREFCSKIKHFKEFEIDDKLTCTPEFKVMSYAS